MSNLSNYDSGAEHRRGGAEVEVSGLLPPGGLREHVPHHEKPQVQRQVHSSGAAGRWEMNLIVYNIYK